MNSFEAERYAGIETHLLKPIAKTFYIDTNKDYAKSPTKLYNSVWDMPEEEFEKYINSIQNQE